MQKNSINRVFLVGFLGNSPEGRYTASGRAVANFSIATHETWKQPKGSAAEHTEWHSVVVWDKLADFAVGFLKKGQLVSVEGRLHTRSWKNKEGQNMKTTEIIASNVMALGTKKEI